MGIALPQLAPASEDRVSGAQVIDGSLKFDGVYLKRTPGSAGNRRTFTWSAWVKLNKLASFYLFNVPDSSGHASLMFDSGQLRWNTYTTATNGLFTSDAYFRDTGWYHVVFVFDATLSTTTDRIKVYVNGERQTSSSYTAPDGTATPVNNTVEHNLGANRGSTSGDINITNNYLIDGQALGPESFGYADGLTNTWRPKKYEGVFNGDAVAAVSYSDNGQMSSSASFSAAPNDAAASFDGSIAGPDVPYLGGSSAEIVWTPTGTLSYSSQIEIYVGGISGFRYNLNNGGWNTPTINSWNTIATGSGTITTIKVDRGGDETHGWHAIRIDGTILVNSPAQNAGVNGFYLPMDGNSPIGEDKSGRGNNWTPVNFGGSVALPKATGAKPILNTDGGGKVARVGVFGSEQNVGYAVTVYNDGGGNKYYIDGTKQATLNGLIRGATYTFNQTDSSNDTHPLVFGTTANGNDFSNGVSITGSPGSTGITSITIPYNAPNILFYHCSAHANMGDSITGITTNEKLADQYASNCTLATPLVGAAGDVSVSIACTSTPKTATVTNANSSSTQSNFYSGSFDFDGSGDYISYGTSSEMDFGSGDCTVECWLYINSHAGDKTIVGSWEGNISWQLSYGTTGDANRFSFMMYNGSTTSADSSELSTNYAGQWVHLAGVRNGNELQIWVNGKKDGTASFSGAHNSLNSAIRIGGRSSGNQTNAHIQDVRIYKGLAKYTSDFVVPATSPDVLPDTPSGVSGGSKLAKVTDGAVSFDGTGDYLSLADNADFNFGTGSLTIEGFFYKNATTANQTLVASQQYYQAGNDGNWVLRVSSGTQIAFVSYNGTSSEEYSEFSAPNGVGGWHHFAFVREGTGSNQSKFYYDGKLAGSMTVSKSLTDGGSNGIFIGDDGSGPNNAFNGFLSNVRVIKGTALYTANFTPPSAPLTDVTNTKLLCCQSNTLAGAAAVFPGTGQQYTSQVSGSDYNATYSKDKMFDSSETSAYLAGDSSNVNWTIPGGLAFSSKLRVRAQGSGSTGTITFNWDGGSYNLTVLNAGAQYYDVTSNVTSPITSITWTTGASAVGPYVSAWEVDDNILVDRGPIANGNVAATNFNPFNTDIKTVRGQETGYATLNPLETVSGITLSEGNLLATGSGATNKISTSTIPIPTSGKWWWEVKLESSNNGQIGIIGTTSGLGNWGNTYLGQVSTGYALDTSNGSKYNNGSNSSYISALGVGDIVNCSYDADSGSLRFYVNGLDKGNAFTGLTEQYRFGVSVYSTTAYSINFGQKPFKFPPPDGFQPLNAANVKPETVITRPDHYVGTVTYTGDSSTSRLITGLNFNDKPDLIWIKNRDESVDHTLYDSIRGFGANKELTPNGTYSEGQTGIGNPNSDVWGYVNSNNFNGFTVNKGSNSTPSLVNSNGIDYVAWCWKAGGNSNTFNIDDVGYATASAAGLTAGTITPTGASVNTKSGFSIITYTGNGVNTAQTISHGLNVKPGLIILKGRDQSFNWMVLHQSLTDRVGKLNTQDSFDTGYTSYGAGSWNPNGITSSTFSTYPGTSNSTYPNADGLDYVAYCWADVPGLQKFGSYTANADANGPFIELGFKPGFVIIRSLSASRNWALTDSERSFANVANHTLATNRADGESYYGGGESVFGASNKIDLLSNGFKLRDGTSWSNGTGETYIYMAWAEAPSFNLYGGQSNAR